MKVRDKPGSTVCRRDCIVAPNASRANWKSMKNQCNSLRHALIDFDVRVSRNSTASWPGAPLERFPLLGSDRHTGGNNSCAIITPALAYSADEIGGDNKSVRAVAAAAAAVIGIASRFSNTFLLEFLKSPRREKDYSIR